MKMNARILMFFFCVFLAACSGQPRVGSDVDVRADGIESIQLTVHGCSEDSAQNVITFTDDIEIAKVIALLKTGKKQQDHKCPGVGNFKISYPDSEIWIDILPGHDKMFYEFRFKHCNHKVKRSEFLEILKGKDYSLESLLDMP